jgi:hypothetical protein
MTNDGRDPSTLIALIFRVVDAPRRTLAVAALAVLLLAAASLVRSPLAELVKSGTLCGGAWCLAGLSWLRERVARSASGACRRRRRAIGSGYCQSPASPSRCGCHAGLHANPENQPGDGPFAAMDSRRGATGQSDG